MTIVFSFRINIFLKDKTHKPRTVFINLKAVYYIITFYSELANWSDRRDGSHLFLIGVTHYHKEHKAC